MKHTHIFLIIILVGLFGIGAYILCSNFYKNFDRQRVTSSENFEYKDTLTCSIVYSTHKKNSGPFLPYLEESNFQLSGLKTDKPKIDSYDLVKISEGDDYATLQITSSRDSVETISILKREGTFVRSVFGRTGLYGDSEFQYIVAQKGYCE